MVFTVRSEIYKDNWKLYFILFMRLYIIVHFSESFLCSLMKNTILLKHDIYNFMFWKINGKGSWWIHFFKHSSLIGLVIVLKIWPVNLYTYVRFGFWIWLYNIWYPGGVAFVTLLIITYDNSQYSFIILFILRCKMCSFFSCKNSVLNYSFLVFQNQSPKVLKVIKYCQQLKLKLLIMIYWFYKRIKVVFYIMSLKKVILKLKKKYIRL